MPSVAFSSVHCVYRYPFKPEQDVMEADWELFLRETANMIVEQQSPRR